MARPKKLVDPVVEQITESAATEREPAPVTVAYTPPAPQVPPAPPAPRQMRVERQGSASEPYVRHHPQVRGGICEFCGVLDPSVPSQFQYKMCPHYRGMQLWCSYCPADKNPDEVNYHAVLNIVDHPFKPHTLLVVCNATECEKKFQEEFRH